jgi:hypothetical protein
LLVILLTRNFNVSFYIYFGALKSLSFLTIDSFIKIGVSNYYIENQGCSKQC